MKDFENIQISDSAYIEHTVTEEDISGYVRLVGDDNPLHLDSEYAKNAGFDGQIVHGMLTASFISTLIGTKLPGPGALWYEASLRFLSPVCVGEKITDKGTVKSKSPALRVRWYLPSESV